MNKNIALLSPNENAYSETFIQAHKKYFDANVYYYYGINFNQLEGHGSINLPVIKRFIWKVISYFRRNKIPLWEINLAWSFKKNKIDKVYAEYGMTGVKILSVCKKMKIPLIVNFHGYDLSINTILEENKIAYKKLFIYSEYIVAVSRTMEKKLVELGAPVDKIVYSPCAPNNDFFHFKPSYSENSFISVGRFVNKKAPYYNILAFQKVLEKFPIAKLYFCGDGSLYNTCVNIVNYFKMNENVFFLGSVSAKELKDIYERATGFLQHSITALDGDMEGTPVAVLEASAAGLPVISTKHAGIQDVVLHEVTGFLVDEHDVDKMAKYMIQLLEDKELAMNMGGNGKKNIWVNYSMEKHISTLNKLLYN